MVTALTLARLALTGFVTALRLVNDVYAAFTAHDTAVAVTLLERAERVFDLHDLSPIKRGASVAPLQVVPEGTVNSWWAVQGSNL